MFPRPYARASPTAHLERDLSAAARQVWGFQFGVVFDLRAGEINAQTRRKRFKA
jgi:hypothetical protein